MDFRRAKYILPNLLTLTSIGAGLYSIHLSTTAQNGPTFAVAAWLVVAAMVIDAFDGRIARMTRSESRLGIQLDSLADAISFGVAPAFLLYHWGLAPWGPIGFAVASAYVGAAVLRLARFNAQLMRGHKTSGPRRHFAGLPTPLAAGTIVSIVLAHLTIAQTATTPAATGVAALTAGVALLMISTVKYRTFRDVDLAGKNLVWATALITAVVSATILVAPSIAFAVVMVAYLVLGIDGGFPNLGGVLLRSDTEGESPAFAEVFDGKC